MTAPDDGEDGGGIDARPGPAEGDAHAASTGLADTPLAAEPRRLASRWRRGLVVYVAAVVSAYVLLGLSLALTAALGATWALGGAAPEAMREALGGAASAVALTLLLLYVSLTGPGVLLARLLLGLNEGDPGLIFGVMAQASVPLTLVPTYFVGAARTRGARMVWVLAQLAVFVASGVAYVASYAGYAP